ncbi:phage tail protein I [Agathobacter rectalis]|uniref:Phage tail protein I n=1 Tax=Agathobacter rectalis TaxID=39491 RepID=A0A413PG38_9FIRM|nr:phage tail protein I [Agathobacter rectalis]
MARMSIFNPNMAKLLPKFMKADETDVALSHAMDVLLAEPANRAKILRKWDQIDNMNDAQLDEMAWEFNIDWWDSSFSLETKRSVIRTCYRVHEKRGTKWAVEELITSASEWVKLRSGSSTAAGRTGSKFRQVQRSRKTVCFIF